jgi:hypothetical protein
MARGTVTNGTLFVVNVGAGFEDFLAGVEWSGFKIAIDTRPEGDLDDLFS